MAMMTYPDWDTNNLHDNYDSLTTGYLTESTVFEDPAIKYDNMGEVAPTTIENYLVSLKFTYSKSDQNQFFL